MPREETDDFLEKADDPNYLSVKVSESARQSIQVDKEEQIKEEKGISFWRAWLLPGVIFYAVAFGFAKLA